MLFLETEVMKILPNDFKNEIVEVKGSSFKNFAAEIRTSAVSPKECDEWMAAFKRSSRMDWNVLKTKHFPKNRALNHGSKYEFEKHWCCAHANKGKTNLNQNRKAKATGCQSRLQIFVLYDKLLEQADQFSRLGDIVNFLAAKN